MTLPEGWIELRTTDQLTDLKAESKNRAIAIFKHSTRCPISSRVISSFQRIKSFKPRVYYLDLLAHRDISNQVAQDFQVAHQSPQLIILKDEKVVYHASHADILSVPSDDF